MSKNDWQKRYYYFFWCTGPPRSKGYRAGIDRGLEHRPRFFCALHHENRLGGSRLGKGIGLKSAYGKGDDSI